MNEKIPADNLFCGIEGVVSIALLRQRVETYGGMQLTKCESIALFDRIANLERENAALESQVKDAVEDAAKYARLARAASDRAIKPPLAIESLNKLLEPESDEPIEILRDGSVRRPDQPPAVCRASSDKDLRSLILAYEALGEKAVFGAEIVACLRELKALRSAAAPQCSLIGCNKPAQSWPGFCAEHDKPAEQAQATDLQKTWDEIVSWRQERTEQAAPPKAVACPDCDAIEENGREIHQGWCAKAKAPQIDKYWELIYAVESAFPGESRHETALRYIREREKHHSGPAQASATKQGAP